eukprot:CAMPEP_0184867378 /NCGR_PEP_ID=MMETSP0580-20130426/26278_1 /TAXON_ID=1118495 /ORGANISM="Dactyliosolen fragilissimus" /LENGTH=452 /DNA_ID=CAMNT_0027367625 /DNA_START=152 /DNA_END=1510 /DNA_ORIENTATION=-
MVNSHRRNSEKILSFAKDSISSNLCSRSNVQMSLIPSHGINVMVIRRNISSCLFLSPSPNEDTVEEESDEVRVMREEIECMRQEARRKLEILSGRVGDSSSDALETIASTADIDTEFGINEIKMDINDTKQEMGSEQTQTSLLQDGEESQSKTQKEIISKPYVERIAVSNDPSIISSRRKQTKRDMFSLLDNTEWKLVLNIGRENGTWMPKTWGISGTRLLLNLEMEFTDEQLYDRDDFLGSMGGSKILKIKDNVLRVAPSISQGQRNVRAKNGGWRVVRGQGPQGTDMLRFYIELEEQISRSGEDVYCPAGRIYCSCGYFPQSLGNTFYDGDGDKERLKKQLEDLVRKKEILDEEMAADTAFISINKIKNFRKLTQIVTDVNNVRDRLLNAMVREPDAGLLSFSQDRNVGLTREGGVCYEVQRSLSIEYHILGTFSVASSRINDEIIDGSV